MLLLDLQRGVVPKRTLREELSPTRCAHHSALDSSRCSVKEDLEFTACHPERRLGSMRGVEDCLDAVLQRIRGIFTLAD